MSYADREISKDLRRGFRIEESRYVLYVAAGCYSADTLGALVLEVLRHRWWHFVHEGRWRD